jgi:hypothetical protein
MSYAIDPSLDYLIAENPITITFFYQTAEGIYNPQGGAKVNWVEEFAIDRQTALSDKDLWTNGRIFMIYKVPYEQAGLRDPPKDKDRIVNPRGIGYRIRQVGILSLGTRYRCVCTQEVS